MADILIATDYVLKQEDSRMTGVITDDPRDSGGRTRYGVAERWHPELTKRGYFTTMPNVPALVLAHKVYADNYGAPLEFKEIELQQLGNAMLSFAINEGVKTSIKILQRSIGVATDGIMGYETLRVANASNVLPSLSRQQRAHYADIVFQNPKDERFFAGWINRVKQDCGEA